jgi:hypothetical protein
MLSSILAVLLVTQMPSACPSGQCARPAPAPPVASYAPYQADYVPPRQAAYTPPSSPVAFFLPVNVERQRCGRRAFHVRYHGRHHVRCYAIVPAGPCGLAGNAR